MTAVFALLLLVGAAGATELRFPQGEKIDIPKVGMRKCYDLQGAAALKALEDERGLLLGTIETQRGLIVVGERRYEQARKKVVSLEQDQLVLAGEVRTMTQRWENENRLRHEADETVVAWRWAAIGTGVGGIAVGVIIGLVLRTAVP